MSHLLTTHSTLWTIQCYPAKICPFLKKTFVRNQCERVNWCLTSLFSTNIWLYQGRKVRDREKHVRESMQRLRSFAVVFCVVNCR